MSINEELKTDFREDFKKWFEEKNGKEPSNVDYILAIVEGSPDMREAAGRAYARTFIEEDGSIDPDLGKYLTPDVSMNYNPDNAFFLELEDKVDKFYLDKTLAYQRWFKNSAPHRAMYEAKLLQKKRVLAVENAYKNHNKAAGRMKELAGKWNSLEEHKLLTPAVNLSLSSKFMDEIRKDPTLERYLPSKLVDNPGTKLSAPFYDEVRNFVQNEKEEYEGFFAIPGDFRTSAMNKLRTDADRDFKLRSNPEKAKIFGQKLRERRAEIEATRNKIEQPSNKSKLPEKTPEQQLSK